MSDPRPSLRDSSPDPAGPVAAYLAEVRKRAALTKPSAHGYTPRGEQLPGGPADDWLIANLTAASHVAPLLAAVEAALKHHQPGKLPWCGTCGPQHQPCQEMADIRRALLGEGE